MKLVQKILSHGLLIAFIVGVFFVYMNRVDLFPQWFAKSAPARTEHSQVKADRHATVATRVSRPEVDRGTQVPAPAKPDTVVSEPVSEAPAAAPEDKQAQTSEADVKQAKIQQGSAGVDSEPEFRPLTETKPVEVEEPVTENKADSQQEEGAREYSEQVVAGQEPAPASDFQERLDLARAHFWRRDIRAALQVYQGLAESYPERADVWGEMGNLYFNIRRAPDAMNAYAHAMELLIKQGDTASARELLDVMYRLDARRASQYEMRLRQTGG